MPKLNFAQVLEAVMAVSELGRSAEAHRRMLQQRQTADEVALEAFRAALSPEQWQSVKEWDMFKVVSNRGHTWIIRTDHLVGNTYRIDYGGFCTGLVWTGEDYPRWDLFLAQALMLRTDEDEYLRVAYRA